MRILGVLTISVCLLLISCDKDNDLCKGISCINGGTCINGDCLCPDQWTGPDCSQEKTPTKIRVGKIEITSFPPTDVGGAGWDLFDGADVYILISKGNTPLYDSDYVEDLTGNYEWTTNFEFGDPEDTYTISVFDYDDGITADDFMGGISFTPFIEGFSFPSAFSVSCGTCVVSFEFTEVVYFH
jgi:hypothetical protein